MVKELTYRLLKRAADQTVRLVGARLPALRPDAAATVPLAAPVRFRPALPRNLEQLPAAFAPIFHEESSLPATHLFALRRVCVSWHAVIFRNLRLFTPALAAPHWKAFYDDSYLLKQWFGKRIAVAPTADMPVVLVHDQWTRNNYYHWVVDALPRLLVLRQQHPQALLIMMEPTPAYVRQTAALLGFEQFLFLKENQVLYTPLLLVPERVAPLGHHNPVLLRELRTEITGKLHTAAVGPPTRRIYVSRSRQSVRRLQNEAAVLDLLSRHGFEQVYFEELSFSEQVALMRETAVLMGVHGANLVNLLFLQSGAHVIELLNEEKFTKLGNINFENLIYYRMSASLELPYFAVPCQTAAGQLPSNEADLEVRLADVERVVRQLPATVGAARP